MGGGGGANCHGYRSPAARQHQNPAHHHRRNSSPSTSSPARRNPCTSPRRRRGRSNNRCGALHPWSVRWFSWNSGKRHRRPRGAAMQRVVAPPRVRPGRRRACTGMPRWQAPSAGGHRPEELTGELKLAVKPHRAQLARRRRHMRTMPAASSSTTARSRCSSCSRGASRYHAADARRGRCRRPGYVASLPRNRPSRRTPPCGEHPTRARTTNKHGRKDLPRNDGFDVREERIRAWATGCLMNTAG